MKRKGKDRLKRDVVEDTEDMWTAIPQTKVFKCQFCGEYGEHVCVDTLSDLLYTDGTFFDSVSELYWRLCAMQAIRGID